VQSIRYLFTSNVLLAAVATQVFMQVWFLAVDAPSIGFLIALWISWKLGCLASLADWFDRWDARAREVHADMVNAQQWFESMPVEDQVVLADNHREMMEMMARAHQRTLDTRDIEYEQVKLGDMLLFPFRHFSRRRRLRELNVAGVHTAKVRFQ
jgi:hypothetical protein